MKQKGSSLVECVIVIALLGILMSSTIHYGMRHSQQIQFRALVSEIEQGITYVRQAAAKTGRQYNVYCLTNQVLVRQGAEKPIYTIKLGESVSIPKNITGKWIRFTGSMASPKVGKITLIHKELGAQADITVGIATGKVSVKYTGLP